MRRDSPPPTAHIATHMVGPQVLVRTARYRVAWIDACEPLPRAKRKAVHSGERTVKKAAADHRQAKQREGHGDEPRWRTCRIKDLYKLIERGFMVIGLANIVARLYSRPFSESSRHSSHEPVVDIISREHSFVDSMPPRRYM